MWNTQAAVFLLFLARLLQQLPKPVHLREHESRIQAGVLQDIVRTQSEDADGSRLGESTRTGWQELRERQPVAPARTTSQRRVVRHLTAAVRSIPAASLSPDVAFFHPAVSNGFGSFAMSG